MFKEIIYRISYLFTVPILKIVTIIEPEIKNPETIYMKFYSNGITYKNYMIYMAGFELRNKTSARFLLYIPSMIVVMIILLVISLVG